MNTQQKQPKVSVIIPVYNTQEYLYECLNSLINQTLSDIEIICVDDGSTDNSIDILYEYQRLDKRIKVILQGNKGGGRARNVGLEHSTGKYVLFLDSDDFFKNDMLEKIYFHSQKTAAEIVIFNYKYYNTVNGKLTESEDIKKYHLPNKEVFSNKDMQKYILTDFCCAAWNKLYSQTFLDKHNIKFHEVQRFNDIYFTRYSLALAERITVLDMPLLYYRIGERGNCQSTTENYPLDFYKTLQKLKNDLKKSSLYDSLNQSYKNLAMNICITSVQKLRGKREQEIVYNFLRDYGFKDLELMPEHTVEERYYSRILYLEYQMMNCLSYKEYLSQRKRFSFYISNIRLTSSSYVNRFLRLLKRRGVKKTISEVVSFILPTNTSMK